jgi:2-C-methyl-D-erythritol 4-phosphate cytidylyltransferase|tara:strand:+ start:138 stop:815 length:678 start_codon:yes stop_codon:yes gene_type:complete
MVTAVIVAAGSGARMEGEGDKLFLEVNQLPVVGHTWRNFDQHPDIDEIVLVVRDDILSKFETLSLKISPSKPYSFVAGGQERQDSVRNGIKAASNNCDVVAIHDGARPCVDAETISNTILAAKEHGASVAATKIVDTIKLSDGNTRISQNVDRTHLWSVQTPQVFKINTILEAMEAVDEQHASVTDDTAACELIGQSVILVESKKPNPKVTTNSDLPFIEFLLKE